jgi:hypothetical protein
LVLADVFMPVRNGYEVCKFVKDDSSLAHIPVILLVGAFDPLDEQEAQRVGADGVLKKPFVPPDPLISMVKSALLRASSGHTAVSATAGKTTASATLKAGSANETVVSGSVPTAVAAPEHAAQTQAFVEDVPARPEEVKIDSSNQPLAFGSLLTSAVPAAEEDAAYVAPVNRALPDRDFGAAESDEVEEEEEEGSESSAWRRDGGNEAFGDEGEATAEKTASRAKRRESWSPTREKTQDLLESAVEPEFVSAPPLEIKAPAAVAVEDSWKKPAKPEPEIKAAPAEPVPAPPAASPAPSLFELPPMPVLSSPVVSSPEGKSTEAPAPETPAPGSSWFSTTTSPWEAEAQKASQMASSWDAPAAPVETTPVKSEEPEPGPQTFEVAESAPTYDFVSEAPSEEPVHYLPDPGLVSNEPVTNHTLPELISDGVLGADAVETLRHETSYAVESVVHHAQEEPLDNSVTGAPAAPDMDELVAKVLAKMSPEMLQAVTREILKPVVEAMVRDEISSKKS